MKIGTVGIDTANVEANWVAKAEAKELLRKIDITAYPIGATLTAIGAVAVMIMLS